MKNKRIYSLWSLILVLFLAFILSGCGTKQASEAPSVEKAAEKPAVEKAAFPTKEIVQLVPFTAGAGFDVQARKVGDELNKILGATIITENLPGAGSTFGLIKLQKEKPDGYMINHIHSESNPIQQVIFNAPYDMRDFRLRF